MKYSEIYVGILKGQEFRHNNADWMIMGPDGSVYCHSVKMNNFSKLALRWIDSDKWEVKPDEIVVWGVCHENGESNLCSKKPIWNGPRWQPDEFVNDHHLKSNLFPKDKPQKYKLIPVEEEL